MIAARSPPRRRSRLVAVGAIGVISSTQTWLVATLDDGAQRTLEVHRRCRGARARAR